MMEVDYSKQRLEAIGIWHDFKLQVKNCGRGVLDTSALDGSDPQTWPSSSALHNPPALPADGYC